MNMKNDANYYYCFFLVDDMGKRLDELESSIGELMTQAGIEEDLSKQAAKIDGNDAEE